MLLLPNGHCILCIIVYQFFFILLLANFTQTVGSTDVNLFSKLDCLNTCIWQFPLSNLGTVICTSVFMMKCRC